MKIPTTVGLNQAYSREEEFNADLAQDLTHLNVGRFEVGETEAKVGTRRADIFAEGDDGLLVVECQFGKADWDHWGRLEAYARLKKATVAVLVAEDFEDLMTTTCELRNADSAVDWYLIKAQATANNEVIFKTVEGPKVEIKTERTRLVVSEFWAPIRTQGVFSGAPLKEGDNWISKSIKGVAVILCGYKSKIKVEVHWPLDRTEERDAYLNRFSSYETSQRETQLVAIIEIPLFNFGRTEVERWDEIRTRLVDVGTDAYEIISKPLE